MDLKEDQILGEKIEEHWYYRSKSRALLKLVAPLGSGNILDVGAGSGFFSKFLLSHSPAVSATCVDPFYPEETDDRHAGKPILFRRSCEDANVDLVLMMDVLEHVDDDLAMLNEYIEKVPVGTRFLITVPAFQFLWSDHDVFLEHHRRYTLAGLIRLVEGAGLVVEKRAYYFGVIFPLVAATRLLGRILGRVLGRNSGQPKSDLKQHSPVTNAILSWLCRIEVPFFKLNRLAGLTVFCVARKIW